mgnify:CR=1 FL=1
MLLLTVFLSYILLTAGLFTGCALIQEEQVKLRDLDFTVLAEEAIPKELYGIIKERYEEPFKLTYSDTDALYIVIGYGRKQTGGYSIAVEELYLTEDAVYVSTTLIGPDDTQKKEETASCPYIVIKTELLDKTVIFQ